MLRSSAVVIAFLFALVGGYFVLACAMQRQVLFPAPPARGAERVRADPGSRAHLARHAGRARRGLVPAAAAAGDRPRAAGRLRARQRRADRRLADAFEPPRAGARPCCWSSTPATGARRARRRRLDRGDHASAFDWARDAPGVDSARIIAYGRSLGGGAVCALARERTVAALVLESTFTSVRRIARGFGAAGLSGARPVRQSGRAARLRGPVLIVHGERDEIIPAAHAAELHAAARGSRLALAPCGHNDCQRPWPLLREFLLENGLLGRSDG